MLIVCSLLVVRPAVATSFTLSGSSSTAQTLTAGQTGLVTSTGSLVTSGSNVPVTMSGNTATLTNNGTISQTGSGRAVQSASTNAVLVIQNNAGATISTASNDTIAAGTGSTTVSSVSLTNVGTILSNAGGQPVNFNKILTGTNTVTNSGLIKAIGSDSVRPGVNGTVTNSGTIQSVVVSGSSSDGIDLQTNTGIQIINNLNGLIDGGRHGITGGPATNIGFTTSITNNLGATIRGNDGSGLNLDGFSGLQTATVFNAGTITGNGVTGDGDGIDVDGRINLTNSGIIRSINSFSSTTPGQSEGVTVGGGTITNSGTIEGLVSAGNLNAFGRGITLAGVDTSGTPEPIYGNSSITNLSGGLIRGQSDSGIAVGGAASGFTVMIDNQAGAIIRGAGLAAATIQTGADNDTVTNAGSIINDGGSGKVAVSLGGGSDTLKITGGNAVVTGGIDGGTGTDSLIFDLGGTNRHFGQNGTISNFESLDLISGDVSLYGALSLGADGNQFYVRSGGVLDLGQSVLTLDHGSVVVSGAIGFVFNGGAGNGELALGSANGGSFVLGSGSALNLSLGSGFHASYGDVFTLVDFQNSSSTASGTFAGLSEGATFTQGGQEFQISYHGGSGGNDIVLTAVPDSTSTLAVLAGSLSLMIWVRRRVFV